MHISGAIFDMDGTLIDSLMLWDILWEDFSHRFCGGKPFRPSEETDKAIRTLPVKEAMYLLHEAHGIGPDGEAVYQACSEVSLNFYSTRVTLKPGVREFMDHCARTGVKMVVATASDTALVNASLNHCGIGHHISALVTCSEVGVGKHEPAVYQKALEVLGTPKEETWVFEDSCVALTSAHKAGFHTVGVYDRHNFGQDTIQALSDIYIAPGEDMTKCIKD